MAIGTKRIISNFLWRLAERFGAQIVSFALSIVLARLLDPESYGTIALVVVFTSIMQVFIDGGFANALIQKKDADCIDFSTVFYFNIVLCLFFYVLIWITAPWIARFYGISDLVPVVRTLGIILIISGVKNVQEAYVARNMLFKKFFYATLGGTIGAAIIGIWMAICGFGIWALVAQSIFNSAVDTIILWLTVKWRPKKVFSRERLKILFSYGWKLLVSRLIDTVYRDLRQLIIGKVYSAQDLAFYNRGNQTPELFITNINSSMDSVLFPALSAEQDHRDRVKDITRNAIIIGIYVIAPIMMGLAACGEAIISLVLTEKWLPSLFYLRVFCFNYMFWPIHTANLNAMKAVGRSDLFLRLEVIKKIIELVAILGTMFISVKAMAYGLIVTEAISLFINMWPNNKLIGYSISEQLKDCLPTVLLSVCMGICVVLVQYLGFSAIFTLLIQIPLGVSIYFTGSKIARLKGYNSLIALVRKSRL